MNDVSKTGYGVDVSAARADELEKRLLAVVTEQVKSGQEVSVLDLGCGAGGAAARLAAAGAATTGVDQYDFSDDWSDKKGEFLHSDIRDLGTLVGGRQFDYCLCNRTLHYVPYAEASEVLQTLRPHVRRSLFISFSGLTSDLARGYAARQSSIESRFGPLAEADQETFGITTPLTLYSQSEAVGLLQQTGWQIDWVRTTDFGNVLIEASNVAYV